MPRPLYPATRFAAPEKRVDRQALKTAAAGPSAANLHFTFYPAAGSEVSGRRYFAIGFFSAASRTICSSFSMRSWTSSV